MATSKFSDADIKKWTASATFSSGFNWGSFPESRNPTFRHSTNDPFKFTFNDTEFLLALVDEHTTQVVVGVFTGCGLTPCGRKVPRHRPPYDVILQIRQRPMDLPPCPQVRIDLEIKRHGRHDLLGCFTRRLMVPNPDLAILLVDEVHGT